MEDSAGCTTMGCREQNDKPQAENKKFLCSKCSTLLNHDQAFCTACGTSVNPHEAACGKCGGKLEKGQQFCPSCGHKAGLMVSPSLAAKIGEINSNIMKKKRYLPIIVGIAAVVVVVVAISIFARIGSDPNLEKIYNEIGADSYYCTLASDGSFLYIDTNPNDNEDSFSDAAWQMIQDVNEELGLPESLEARIGNTTSLDGRQTESYEDITVSWTYHPDDGLEIIYEVK